MPPCKLRQGLAFLLLLLLGATGLAQAQTVLPDTLRPAEGRVFRLSDYPGPYYVNRRCTVMPGDTLLAGPGDTLLFQADTLSLGSLYIQGTLLAGGSEDSLVVFKGQAGNIISWPGLYFRPAGGDSSRSILRYVHLDGANTTINCNRPPRYGDGHSLLASHCLITNSSFGTLFFSPAVGRVENCVFDDQRNTAVYVSSSQVEVLNSVFQPHELYPLAKAISYYNPTDDPLEAVHHNLFDPGPANWSGFFVTLRTGDTAYTILEPDSTNLIQDPQFRADRPYHPDPANSPLIDAGDPSLLDPDGSISDIGVFWVNSVESPFRIVGDLAISRWVVGYNYQSLLAIEGFPLPAWELVGAPAGLTVANVGRSRAMLSWPVSFQQEGPFAFWLKGGNVTQGDEHRDSLWVELEFLANRPPRIALVQPCPEGDCLGMDHVLLDGLASGSTVQVEVRAVDDDESILAGNQPRILRSWLNGVPQPQQTGFQFLRTVDLDTARVVLDVVFSDGLARDSLRMDLKPVYSLLSGEVTGVIGNATGAVYLTGPLSVPAGGSLLIQAGSRLVDGGLPGDQPLLDVRGSLLVEGTAESPVEFRSLATHRADVDERPSFLRVQTGGSVERIAHARFTGFSTAIALEHLEQDEPVRVDSCEFEHVRLGVLAVGTPVEIQHCRFLRPADSLRLGSSSIYLASSQGSRVRNNLFLNPIVGVTAVDSDAEIANNSFLWVRTRDPRTGLSFWPGLFHLGFGRVHAFSSTLDVRNNLFQWRGIHGGNTLTESQLATYLESPVHALWLDEDSQVRAEYNWYDCRNGWMDTDEGPLNVSRWTAVNDSTRLLSHVVAGADSAKVDEENGWRLFADSPLIDAGDPGSLWSDAFDGSRNDIGWTGGPLALVNEYTGMDGSGPRPRPEVLPTAFRLAPPYPNPFNPVSWLEVEMDRPGALDVRVHDMLGRQVAVLAQDRLEPGVYRLRVDGSAWASGVYVVRARLGDEQQSQRLLLVK